MMSNKGSVLFYDLKTDESLEDEQETLIKIGKIYPKVFAQSDLPYRIDQYEKEACDGQ